jgi:uroporphyrinogen decarboxylase
LAAFYLQLAENCRGIADFIGFGDDFASQQSMLIDPKKWREIFLPQWRRLYAIAHGQGFKVIMHSCGAVRPVLRDLIEAGIDVLQVMQINASGMDPAELKKEFGNSISFYGGVDTQELLPHGTPARVRQEVRRLIDIVGKGGRYILSSWHFLMDDVPVDNALALYDEARLYHPTYTV